MTFDNTFDETSCFLEVANCFRGNIKTKLVPCFCLVVWDRSIIHDHPKIRSRFYWALFSSFFFWRRCIKNYFHWIGGSKDYWRFRSKRTHFVRYEESRSIYPMRASTNEKCREKRGASPQKKSERLRCSYAYLFPITQLLATKSHLGRGPPRRKVYLQPRPIAADRCFNLRKNALNSCPNSSKHRHVRVAPIRSSGTFADLSEVAKNEHAKRTPRAKQTENKVFQHLFPRRSPGGVILRSAGVIAL